MSQTLLPESPTKSEYINTEESQSPRSQSNPNSKRRNLETQQRDRPDEGYFLTKGMRAYKIQTPQYELDSEEIPSGPQKQDEDAGNQQQLRSKNTSHRSIHNTDVSNDSKKGTPVRERNNFPTFGEVELNSPTVQSVPANDTDNNVAQPRAKKIDKLLEEHKKRKAMAQVFEIDSEEVSPIPINPLNASEKMSVFQTIRGPSQTTDFNLSGVDKEFYASFDVTQQLAQSNVSTAPEGSVFAKRNLTDPNDPQLTNLRKQAAALQIQIKQIPPNFKQTGKFVELAAGKDLIEPLSGREATVDMTIKEPISPIRPTGEKSNRSTNSRRTSQEAMESRPSVTQTTSPKNIPQINVNSHKIYHNSQRARDDEKIIQELLTTQAKRLIQAEGREYIKLQKIPEVTEENLPTTIYSKNSTLATPKKVLTPLSSLTPSPTKLTNSNAPTPKLSTPKNVSPKQANINNASPAKQANLNRSSNASIQNSRVSSMKIIPSHQMSKNFDFDSARASDELKNSNLSQQAPQMVDTASPDKNTSLNLAEKIMRVSITATKVQDSPKTRKSTNLLESQNTTLTQQTTNRSSPKKSALKKTFQSPNEFDFSAIAQAITSPPLNATGNTIVEHKRTTSTIQDIQQIKQNLKKKGIKSLSPPVRQELKKIASQPKQIYLKVVDNRADTFVDQSQTSPSFGKKPVSQQTPREASESQVASELLKALIKKGESYGISEEELAQYDEVQRLEVILHNLQQIQKANLLSLLNVGRPRTEAAKQASLDMSNVSASKKKKYADSVNDSAMELRHERRRKEEERIAKLTGPSEPQKMQKVDLSAQSLYNSAVVRQKIMELGGLVCGDEFENDPLAGFGGNNGEAPAGQVKSWTDMEVWERNQLWLDAKLEKMEKLNESQRFEELRECTFKPNFVTKQFSNTSIHSSKAEAGQSRNLGYSIAERTIAEDDERQETEGETTLEQERSRSLYQEKKTLDSYNAIADLRRSYNLYKSEFFIEKQDHRTSIRVDEPVNETQNYNSNPRSQHSRVLSQV